ncbi:uncharacterized protein NFIA_007880 [Aspergillus fischeri NRRL 181]|uniref:BZIP domain-containing protein n=1 Tax=Neosartorya fischeri (strain ATCC 1020 / DSM 3700 / CBS 544.65 / FGSC A1164 / JCM 1740 / NRRL 181 / WB 181) TaxID=331117 RepID=A1D118_NEOFI|nr:uncharacterized protein NFIA_007880 [Aspergillus fischeri NRRL 181]EAW22111.1 hypothetical protein NFIA_007880 [Aspergillus fischeri NRRL 181]
MPQDTTEKKARSESLGKEKRKPVRSDPEKRRQQNIRAQREKLRGRLEDLEMLAASLAQRPPMTGKIQSESILGDGAWDVSIPGSSIATPKDCQQLLPQSDYTASTLNIWDSTTHLTSSDNTLSSPNVWDSILRDCTAQLSHSDISPSTLAFLDSTKQFPPSETPLTAPRVWVPPTHVIPSVLIQDKHRDGIDRCWSTTTIKCNCSSPHFMIQTHRPGPYSSTEVRILRTGPVIPTPDPYANHLRLETICTLAAMDTLRMHISITEEMMCTKESPSPFYRSLRASADDMVKENMICTVQRIFMTLKPDLRPSIEQITVKHPPYIDVLPFRTLRKNLILQQQEVDEDEFLRDAVTGLVCWGGAGVGRKDRDTSTGYASTGTPWDNRSWEAKEWFLKKYWSLLGGEEGELVRQSEWWRNIRGEDPLDIEAVA